MRGRKPTPRIIAEFNNRQTGSFIQVDYGLNEMNCYQATCYTHGYYVNAETYSAIMQISRDPVGWCEGCQEQHWEA